MLLFWGSIVNWRLGQSPPFHCSLMIASFSAFSPNEVVRIKIPAASPSCGTDPHGRGAQGCGGPNPFRTYTSLRAPDPSDGSCRARKLGRTLSAPTLGLGPAGLHDHGFRGAERSHRKSAPTQHLAWLRILCKPAVGKRENCRPGQPGMGDTTVEILEGGRPLRLWLSRAFATEHGGDRRQYALRSERLGKEGHAQATHTLSDRLLRVAGKQEYARGRGLSQ